jgi:hypothetical protein
LDPALSVNLEQRKKRKDSFGGSESRRNSKEETTQPLRQTTGALKTGAKRKLSVRDDDEIESSLKSADDLNDFKYKRGVSEERSRTKLAAQPEKPNPRPFREHGTTRGTVPREISSSTPTVPARKVLAPKSVNNSPRKSAKPPVLDEIKSAKSDATKPFFPKGGSREKRQESVLMEAPADPVVDTIELPIPCESPAGIDMFSPFSSQPSTARPESRDTPPPAELGPGNEGQRPSRRARGAVSYAEPNLRDKMRRPTKELADAVGAEVKGKSIVKLEDGSTSVQIKSEPEADETWKNMPVATYSTVESSPLSGKTSTPDALPSNITTHRKRRESMLYPAETELTRPSSGSSISALLTSNRKAKAEAKEKAPGDDGVALEPVVGDIDIYEFTGSPTIAAEEAQKPSKGEKPVSRFSRRFSSISKDVALIDDGEASDIEMSKKVETLSSRRRQSTLGLRGSTSSVELGKDLGEDKPVKKASVASRPAEQGNAVSRSDRIAARRRSMML